MIDLEAALATRTRLAASWVELAHDPSNLSQVTRDLAERLGDRVELLDRDGAVLASAPSRAPFARRAREPDVVAARGGRAPGFVVEGRTLFCAWPLQLAGNRDAVLRVGASLAGVDRSLAQLRGAIVAGGALLLVLLLGVAQLMARFSARGLGALNEVARKMAAGDLEARSGLEGQGAVADLGRTLDTLARGLSSSLEELRGERDRMAGILRGMQEGVLLLDANRRIVILNPALREMLLLPADAAGKPLLDVVRHAELRDLFHEASNEEEPVTREVEIGSIKPRRLLARVARMPGEGQELVAVFVDVTEVRRLESMRRDFVANVSHELRTPVTAIRSAAETLSDGAAADPKAAGAFIAIIERHAQRLQALVEDLLDLSRIEARGFRLNLEPLQLEPIFSQVLGLFRERAAERKLSLEERALGDLPQVQADRRALEHVLTNLLDNAVKYCGPGARVWLAVAVEERAVVVSVSDDGPGIEARHLPRLFERFYRVDAGRSREVGGTGLGLSIVKHLVEAMGGTVAVESTLNAGTTFSFSLPRAVS